MNVCVQNGKPLVDPAKFLKAGPVMFTKNKNQGPILPEPTKGATCAGWQIVGAAMKPAGARPQSIICAEHENQWITVILRGCFAN